jgi:hypothetical protein
MPLEFVTDSFLPSEEAQGAISPQQLGEKLCCSRRKPDGNDRDKTGAVAPTIHFVCLLYGRAVLFNSFAIGKGMSWACLFVLTSLLVE